MYVCTEIYMDYCRYSQTARLFCNSGLKVSLLFDLLCKLGEICDCPWMWMCYWLSQQYASQSAY